MGVVRVRVDVSARLATGYLESVPALERVRRGRARSRRAGCTCADVAVEVTRTDAGAGDK